MLKMLEITFQKKFLGREALLRQNETGISKRFVQLLVDRHDMETDPWPQAGGVIYRDGKPIGRTASAAYGYTLGCQVCIGYIENEQFGVTPEFISKGEYEIDIAGERFAVRVNQHSPTLPMISSELPAHYLPTQ
ncbi:unnamed protein product [Toxocara canis]|uniref:GCV_T_C domain-containing protein n=1 Tax=Toxocara canis TaxID=6265 RepID=A0A183U623_TOXCA|nr:unnamed protein product [Toxocara canis]